MKNMHTIHSTKIKNLVTKFYYRDNHLCFQILLHCEGDETIVFKEFMDYAEYKLEYNRLLGAKSANECIVMPQQVSQNTHMSFV